MRTLIRSPAYQELRVRAQSRSPAGRSLQAGAPALPPSSGFRLMAVHVLGWVKACGDAYAAAAMYEQLSALSDSELNRRGLARATLAEDVRVACESH